MSKRLSVSQAKLLNQHRYILKKLASVDSTKRNKVLKNAPSQLFKALDIIFTMIADNRIPLSKKHENIVKKHQRFIRSTADLKQSAIKRRAQSGGAFGAVLSALLPIISSVISKLF